jgi:hypothetical protein
MEFTKIQMPESLKFFINNFKKINTDILKILTKFKENNERLRLKFSEK